MTISEMLRQARTDKEIQALTDKDLAKIIKDLAKGPEVGPIKKEVGRRFGPKAKAFWLHARKTGVAKKSSHLEIL